MNLISLGTIFCNLIFLSLYSKHNRNVFIMAEHTAQILSPSHPCNIFKLLFPMWKIYEIIDLIY